MNDERGFTTGDLDAVVDRLKKDFEKDGVGHVYLHPAEGIKNGRYDAEGFTFDDVYHVSVADYGPHSRVVEHAEATTTSTFANSIAAIAMAKTILHDFVENR